MQVWILGLAVAIAATLSSPAIAQQAPAGPRLHFRKAYTGPSIPHWGYVPNAADIRKANAAEKSGRSKRGAERLRTTRGRQPEPREANPGRQLYVARLDRKMLSQRLAEMGNPTWTFVRNEQTSAGTVSLYALKYATSSVYVTFGVDDNGVVYALGLSKRRAASLSRKPNSSSWRVLIEDAYEREFPEIIRRAYARFCAQFNFVEVRRSHLFVAFENAAHTTLIVAQKHPWDSVAVALCMPNGESYGLEDIAEWSGVEPIRLQIGDAGVLDTLMPQAAALLMNAGPVISARTLRCRRLAQLQQARNAAYNKHFTVDAPSRTCAKCLACARLP